MHILFKVVKFEARPFVEFYELGYLDFFENVVTTICVKFLIWHLEFLSFLSTAGATKDVFQKFDEELEHVVSENIKKENNNEEYPINL